MYGQNPYQNYPYSGYGMPTYGQRQYIPQPPQQPMSQPQAQVQQQMPMQYETPIQAVRYATEEEAKAFIVYPNLSAVFIDEGKSKVYLKTANNAGVSSIRCYNEEKAKDESQNKAPQRQSEQVDFGQFANKEQLKGFVTIQQYNDLLEQQKFLADQLRIMQKQLMGGKQNVGTATQNTAIKQQQ